MPLRDTKHKQYGRQQADAAPIQRMRTQHPHAQTRCNATQHRARDDLTERVRAKRNTGPAEECSGRSRNEQRHAQRV